MNQTLTSSGTTALKATPPKSGVSPTPSPAKATSFPDSQSPRGETEKSAPQYCLPCEPCPFSVLPLNSPAHSHSPTPRCKPYPFPVPLLLQAHLASPLPFPGPMRTASWKIWIRHGFGIRNVTPAAMLLLLSLLRTWQVGPPSCLDTGMDSPGAAASGQPAEALGTSHRGLHAGGWRHRGRHLPDFHRDCLQATQGCP